jgi:DNA-binding transcriptional LysR family regulator
MTNIPTDLLRTFVAVVDLRSFTKAAKALGVTQPAVSAQIKRLQSLLGGELFDKSAPGVSLTANGEVVLNHARRLLAINDQILRLSVPSPQTVRIGAPGDLIVSQLPPVMAEFRRRWPDTSFSLNIGSMDEMLRDLQAGNIDVVVGLSGNSLQIQPRHRWPEEAVWVRSPATTLDPQAPVPMVSCADDCVFYRTAAQTLAQAGRKYEQVFCASSFATLAVAVEAGLGTTVLPRSRVGLTSLSVWEDAPLPPLPTLNCGVYLREAGNSEPVEQFAISLATTLAAAACEPAAQLALANNVIGSRAGQPLPQA